MIGIMFYLNKVATKVAIYKNLIYFTNMKRMSNEDGVQIDTLKKAEKAKAPDSDSEGTDSEDILEPGTKRINMPKKSKYRTRAHINPMGDLKIPT